MCVYVCEFTYLRYRGSTLHSWGCVSKSHVIDFSFKFMNISGLCGGGEEGEGGGGISVLKYIQLNDTFLPLKTYIYYIKITSIALY